MVREKELNSLTTYLNFEKARLAKSTAKQDLSQREQPPGQTAVNEILQGHSASIIELRNTVQEQINIVKELTQSIQTMHAAMAQLHEEIQTQQNKINTLTAYIKEIPSAEKKGFFASRRRMPSLMNTLD